jgi:error-prone DNA polymerase
MIYQEDVIKVCIHYAGMDGADADILRRGMSGKWRSEQEMNRIKDSFFNGSKKLARPEDISRGSLATGKFLSPVIVFPKRIPPVSR